MCVIVCVCAFVQGLIMCVCMSMHVHTCVWCVYRCACA